MSSVASVDPALRPQMRALGATRWQATWAQLVEARFGVIVGIVAGFGSIISEVGAVMLVGGNIEGRTRVLTTAIVLETRQGEFAFALALGIILLMLSFIANALLVVLQGRAGTRPMTLYTIKDLTHRYGSRTALQIDDLRLEPGEVYRGDWPQRRGQKYAAASAGFAGNTLAGAGDAPHGWARGHCCECEHRRSAAIDDGVSAPCPALTVGTG